ncbi:unnamed protein product [Ranitomeya imitator]|uniref:Helix-turn-helix domain-containing protein n=1 Tax=Ranitomeya imitator TaxID=111125 RepID=A0ABN9LFI7_9NEOB|nr:unnamed protein product [Ranitomeya imitator]
MKFLIHTKHLLFGHEFFLDLLKWRNWNMSAVSFSYSETEVANIVSQVTASSDFLQVSGSEFKSRDLERETRHLVSLELHSITIAEYIKTQRIPRGLRVSLRPTLFQDNSDFCSRFEQILNKCSVDLMTLTLDQLNKEIKNSQDKVSSIETQLKDSLSKDEFDLVKTRTKENVDNFRKETEKRKRQKFIRDTQDYLHKRVYRWQNPSFRPNYRGYRYTDGSSASSSDNERMDFQRSFLGQGRRYNTRKGRGGVANVSETNRHTMNTRSQSLNTSQLRLLEKGLSFCPTYKFNAFQLNVDLERFYRNLRLKAYFCEQTPMTTQAVVTQATPINLKDLGLKLRSNFSPPKSCAPVETFITLINKEVTNFCKQIVRGDFMFRSNLGQTERMALKTLMEDRDIVIKAADKGGAIVIMDHAFYRSEILSQLANRDVYQPLTNNPTPSIRNKIMILLDEALSTGIIDKKTKEFLTNEYPIIPVFYVLPKIHKNLERPPGRPIVASTDSILSPFCHPKAVKRSIPQSQFERVRRIVSDSTLCSQRLDEMEAKFLQRGYPHRILDQSRRNVLCAQSSQPDVVQRKAAEEVSRHLLATSRWLNNGSQSVQCGKSKILAMTEGQTLKIGTAPLDRGRLGGLGLTSLGTDPIKS